MRHEPLQQQEVLVLSFVIGRISAGKGIPSYREIGQAMEWKCPSSPWLQEILWRLARKGYVLPADNRGRALEVLRLPSGRRILGWAPVVDPCTGAIRGYWPRVEARPGEHTDNGFALPATLDGSKLAGRAS